MKNRFHSLFQELSVKNGRHSYLLPSEKKNKVASAQTKKGNCPQMSEVVEDPDDFVLDILEFFFQERLTFDQLNDQLREVAAQILWTAVEASKSIDTIPHPPLKMPTPFWLVSEAVQIAFRKANNRCIYITVKNQTALKWRSAYEIARLSSSQSYPSRNSLKSY